MIRVASISECGKYRYYLIRIWDGTLPICAFVGLNPSTADADNDDPTIRRCAGFAKSWGYGGIVMLNAYGYRATKPREMLAADDPAGVYNDAFIAEWCQKAAIVVACWGNHIHKDRASALKELLSDKIHYLKLTKEGQPSHPLYLKKELKPIKWPKVQNHRFYEESKWCFYNLYRNRRWVFSDLAMPVFKRIEGG